MKEPLPQLIPAVVVEWSEPRFAQTMLRVSNTMYPLTSQTEHLKRIRSVPSSSSDSISSFPSTSSSSSRARSTLQLLLEAGAAIFDALDSVECGGMERHNMHRKNTGTTSSSRSHVAPDVEEECNRRKSEENEAVGLRGNDLPPPPLNGPLHLCHRCRRRCRSTSTEKTNDGCSSTTCPCKTHCLDNHCAAELKAEETEAFNSLLRRRYEKFTDALRDALFDPPTTQSKGFASPNAEQHNSVEGEKIETSLNVVVQLQSDESRTQTTNGAMEDSRSSDASTKDARMWSFRLVYVPDRAPRQDPELWTQYNNEGWPFALPKPTRPPSPSPALVSFASRIMQEVVLPLAVRRARLGQLGLAAVVVDPATEQILASSDEDFLGMPRTNIAACAPYGVPNQASFSSSSFIPEMILDHPITYALKQLARHQHAAQQEKEEHGYVSGSGGADSARNNGTTLAATETVPPRVTAERQGPSSGKPYLANSLDVYVSHEPCVMCAMALVHSRVQRVFFCYPNAYHGGLGSCYAVHSLPSLNHHFQAFHCFEAGVRFTPSGQALLCGDEEL